MCEKTELKQHSQGHRSCKYWSQSSSSVGYQNHALSCLTSLTPLFQRSSFPHCLAFSPVFVKNKSPRSCFSSSDMTCLEHFVLRLKILNMSISIKVLLKRFIKQIAFILTVTNHRKGKTRQVARSTLWNTTSGETGRVAFKNTFSSHKPVWGRREAEFAQ